MLRWWLLLTLSLAQAFAAPNKLDKPVDYTNSSLETGEVSELLKSSPRALCVVDRDNCDCFNVFQSTNPRVVYTRDRARSPAKDRLSVGIARNAECVENTEACTCEWVETVTDPLGTITDPLGPVCVTDEANCACGWNLDLTTVQRKTNKLGNATKLAGGAARDAVCISDTDACTCEWIEFDPLDPITDPLPPVCVTDEANCACGWDLDLTTVPRKAGELGNATNAPDAPKAELPIECSVDRDSCTCAWTLSQPPSEPQCVVDLEECVCGWVVADPATKTRVGGNTPKSAADSGRQAPPRCLYDETTCTCAWSTPAPPVCITDTRRCLCEWAYPPRSLANDTSDTCVVDEVNCQCTLIPILPPTRPCLVNDADCTCVWGDSGAGPTKSAANGRVDNVTRCVVDEVNCQCTLIPILPPTRPCLVNEADCTCVWGDSGAGPTKSAANGRVDNVTRSLAQGHDQQGRQGSETSCQVDKDTCSCEWVQNPVQCVIDIDNCDCGWQSDGAPRINVEVKVKVNVLRPVKRRCLVDKQNCACSWVQDTAPAPACLVDKEDCRCSWVYPGRSAQTDKHIADAKRPEFKRGRPIPQCVVNSEACTCEWQSPPPPPPPPQCFIDEVNCKCYFGFPPFPDVTLPSAKPIGKKCVVNKDACTCNWVSVVPKCIIDEVHCKCGFAFPPYPAISTSPLVKPIGKKCIINQETCTCNWVSVKPKCIIDAVKCKCAFAFPPYPITTSPAAIPIGCHIDEKACLCKWVLTSPNAVDVLEKVKVMLSVIADLLQQLEPAVRGLRATPVGGLAGLRSEQREKLVEGAVEAIRKLSEVLARGELSRLERLEEKEAVQLQSHLDGQAAYLKRMLQDPNYLVGELGQLASEKPRPIIKALMDTLEKLNDIFN